MKIVLIYIFLFSGTANDSDNISKQFDMIEAKSIGSDGLFSIFKNTNMVDDHQWNDKTTSKSKNCN